MQKIIKNTFLLILTSLVTVYWSAVPPEGLSEQGMHLGLLFAAMVGSILVGALPISVICLIAGLVAVLTYTLSISDLLSGFSDKIVWLLAFTFFLSSGFVSSGLGMRVAFFFISRFGKTVLGLAYSLAGTEMLFATVIPSVTARGGAIMFPIIQALIAEYSKESSSDSLSDKIATFLVMTAFHTNIITAAMFLTAMVGNPLIARIALSSFGVNITWATWAIYAIVPGVLSLLILPIALYYLCGLSSVEGMNLTKIAKTKLQNMGKLTKDEMIMLVTLVLLIIFWIFSETLDIDPTTTAMMGAVLLVLTKVIKWENALNNASAWDTVIWFAIFVTFAAFLNSLGVVKWFASFISAGAGAFKNPTIIAAFLALVYFYIHYFMASLTSHVVVLYQVFVGLAIVLGQIDPFIACMLFAFFSLLCGCLTHYGSAVAPIFYGAGYVSMLKWWRIGFVISILHIIVWGGVGPIWWKTLAGF